MAESKLSVNIGTKDLKTLAEYKLSGVILIHVEKKFLGFPLSKWRSRYVVVCKGKVGTWNLVCYLDHLSSKAEVIYSMLEFESVKEYNEATEGITGFMIKFEKPLAPLIFSCDTKDSQMVWIENIHCAIEDAHRFSADSAYASGGSIASFSESNRISKPYNIIDDSHFPAEKGDTSQQGFASENVTEETIRHPSIQGKVRNNGEHKDMEATYVKDIESHPVQESKHQGTAQREESARTDKQVTTGYAKKTCEMNRAQEIKQSKNTIADTEPDYEIIRFDDGNLQPSDFYDETAKPEDLKLPTQDNDDMTHSHTDVKQIAQGDETLRPQLATHVFPPKREDSALAKAANSSLFLSVQGGQEFETDTKSFVSMREGTDQSVTMHPTAEEQQLHSRTTDNDISVVSVEENEITRNSTKSNANANHESSPLKRSQSAASNDRPEVHPQLSSSVIQRSESQGYTSCQSKRYGIYELCSSLITEEGSSLAQKDQMNHPTLSLDTGNDSNERHHTLSATVNSSDNASTFKQSVSGKESCTVQDDDCIYENTGFCKLNNPDRSSKEMGNSRNSQESEGNRKSISSTSSFSSNGSEASLKKYESPDEETDHDYQNTKVFEMKEYFYQEKKNVKRIMTNTATGTFLVCPGETTREEICVMTPCGIRYFRVHERVTKPGFTYVSHREELITSNGIEKTKHPHVLPREPSEGKYSLFKDSSNQAFPSMESLLSYYHMFANLPTMDYEVQLTRGYNNDESSAN